MRHGKVILVLGTLAVGPVADGQWLEAIVPMPDSLAGAYEPEVIFCDTLGNTTFVSGEDGNATVLVDAVADQKVGRIDGFCPDFCLDPVQGRVLAARRGAYPGYDSTVLVIDAGQRAVVDSFRVGWAPSALCYDQVDRQVYCADRYCNTVSVIDLDAGAVVRRVVVGREPDGLVYNPAAHKVYCTCNQDGTVTVIDAAQDEVLATHYVGRGQKVLCVNEPENKVYCAGYYSSLLAIISGQTDSVLSFVSFPSHYVVYDMCYSPRQNELYAITSGRDSMYVVDGAQDSVVGVMPTGHGPRALSYDCIRDRVYCANGSSDNITVHECGSHRVIDSVRVGNGPQAIACNPRADRVYAGNTSSDDLTVIEADSLKVAAQLLLASRPYDLCYDYRGDKVYCSLNPEGVSVIDGARNRVLTTFPTYTILRNLCHNQMSDKVYGIYKGTSGIDAVVVLDAVGDSILGSIQVGEDIEDICYAVVQNKAYCVVYGDSSVVVLCGEGDSIVGRVHLVHRPNLLCYNPRENKIYVSGAGADRVSVLDADADTILATIGVHEWPHLMCYNHNDNNVYCTVTNGVAAFDGAGDSLRARIELTESQAYDICYALTGNKVYVSSRRKVFAIDCSRDSVVAVIPLRESATDIEYDVTNNKLYCLQDDFNEVAVIDCWTDSVVGAVGVPADPRFLAWNPRHSRMYVACDDGRAVAVLRDSMVPAVAERAGQGPTGRALVRTVVSRVLELTGSCSGHCVAEWTLVDVTGRKVMGLRPGENDLSSVAPGVYFVSGCREAGGWRVVVAR